MHLLALSLIVRQQMIKLYSALFAPILGLLVAANMVTVGVGAERDNTPHPVKNAGPVKKPSDKASGVDKKHIDAVILFFGEGDGFNRFGAQII